MRFDTRPSFFFISFPMDNLRTQFRTVSSRRSSKDGTIEGIEFGLMVLRWNDQQVQNYVLK